MPIHYEQAGRTVRITIDRPEALNALDPAHNEAIAAAFARFRDDDGAWVAIVTGAGDRAFSAGADLKALIPERAASVRAGKGIGTTFAGITRGFTTWKPLIAAVNGYAVGGGLELALCCDLRVAAEHARFGLPEVKWGIIPGAGGTQRLPRAIPLAKAMELLLTGELIDAQEALRLGLVNRVVPLADLLPTAQALADLILQRGPLAVRAAKRAALEGLDGTLEEGLALETRLSEELLRTEDAAEGMRAFAEKRPARFEAR
jgi:enoyl-CoA hydratase/carnithine racemase